MLQAIPMNDPIDSRQLNAFVSISRSGSFTAAAKELSLTQSAVSHAIKALESSVGCRIFDRLGKKMVLTLAGEQLLHHAQKILTEMDSARDSLTNLGKWGRGRLRVGASTAACQYILPAVLGDFQESYPKSLIAIQPCDVEQAISLLRNGKIDLAVCLEPSHHADFEFVSLFTDELMFILSPLHPWANHPSIPRAEIPTQNYVLYSRSSYLHKQVEQYFSREGMVLNTVIELGSMEAIKELVKLGLGVSILAPWIARAEIRDGTLTARGMGRRKLRRQWGILFVKGKTLDLQQETFIKLCREATATRLFQEPLPPAEQVISERTRESTKSGRPTQTIPCATL